MAKLGRFSLHESSEFDCWPYSDDRFLVADNAYRSPAPVHFGAFVALMRRASLTNSLMAPVIGSDRPALSVRSATICMSLSAQVKEILSHSLSASEAPELISKAARSLPRSMPVVSASRPASIRPTALIQSSRLFMVLPTWPWPTSPRWAKSEQKQP